jgi:hypothetical protein
MASSYKSLLGLADIDANGIVADRVEVGEIITKEITADIANITNLILPDGAVKGHVLTSDEAGLAKWAPIPDVVLIGDANGPPEENVINTLAGTIQVANLVTLDGVQTITNKDITATSLTVTGPTVVADITAASLHVTGSSTLNDTTATSLNVTGSTTVNDITVNGLTNTGNIYTSGITVMGPATITDLTVLNNSTLNDATVQNLETNIFKIPTGAASSKVLTSDGLGNATWQDAPTALPFPYTTSATPNTFPFRNSNGDSHFNLVQMNSLVIPPGAGSNKVLTSDGSGNATWQSPSSATQPASYNDLTNYSTGDLVSYKGLSLYKWNVVPGLDARTTHFTLGMLMKFITDGSITHLSMYMASAGSYSMSIYVANADGSGSWLMRTTTVNRASPGWATARLGEPIIIDITKMYLVCFNTGGLYFNSLTAGTPSTFAQVTPNPAIVPIEGARYQYGDNINLFQNFNVSAGANYYTDVVFVPTKAPVLTIYKAIVDTNYYPSFPPSTPSQLVDWVLADNSFDPTNPPSFNAAPNTIVTRDSNASSSFGGINTIGVIYTGNQLKNKVVVLWGDPANQDTTDFYGLGINSATLRYNVPTGAAHRFYINSSNVVDIANGMAINVGGLYLPAGGSPLNYYEEYTHTTSWYLAFGINSGNVTIKLVRQNNLVFASFTMFSYNNPGPDGSVRMKTNTPFPTRFCPTVATWASTGFYPAVVQGQQHAGLYGIGYDGIFAMTPGLPHPIVAPPGMTGSYSFTATWTIAKVGIYLNNCLI